MREERSLLELLIAKSTSTYTSFEVDKFIVFCLSLGVLAGLVLGFILFKVFT